MRKMLAVVALVFALAFTFAVAAPAEAIGGGGSLPSNCTYKCSCSGAPLRCCESSNGTVFCTSTDDIACPQVYNC